MIADLVAELVGIREGLLERDPIDRDRVRWHPGHVAALGERNAVVQAEEIGVLGVLGLDDDRHVGEGGGEVRRELVERCANVVVERHRMTSAMSAFCVWSLFSACSQARQRAP